MKKKVLALLVALTLVFAYAVPAAAAETVSADPQVQAAYDAYSQVTEALSINEYGPMKDALDEYNRIIEDFTEAQSDEWNDIVYGSVGVDIVLGNLIDASMVVCAMEDKDAFTADSNAKTAVDFVSSYDECKDSGITIELFDPDIETAYETAKANYMPTENTIKVYDAYLDLAQGLDVLAAGFYNEEFVAGCEAFEAVLDTFNALTNEEMTDLAVLMGEADGEAAYNVILSDWINANLALELGALCDEYLSSPTVKTATDFVELYEEYLNDTQILTDTDKAVILTAFESTYEDAKAFLAETDNNDEATEGTTEQAGEEKPAVIEEDSEEPATEGIIEETTEQADKVDKPDKDASPETGDDFNAAPYAALMMIAAVVAGLAVKRRKIQ